MWLTRILHVFIFNLCLQISIGHLNALPNTGLNNPIISSALHNNGLIIPKNLNQIPKPQKSLNIQQINKIQKPVNLQQPNIQQSPNLQQRNFQQAVNLQQGKNLQQLNIQQSGFHPNSFQQQNVIPKMNNLQFPNQQPRAFQTSSPILNSNLAGINNPLPDKPLTSGINSNQGIQSHLNQGSTASNFNFHPNVGMKYTGFIQNGQIPSTDIALNINQASPNQFPTIPETSINNQPSLTVLTQPGQDPNIIQNLPMDYQKQIAIIKSVQPQHSLDGIQNQLPAINLNQIPTLPPTMPEPLNYGPLATGYSADSLLNTIIAKKSSKSPNLKALLPLIFNLLKEKNSGCGCHCGCVNDNMPNPQIFSGYAKQNNYGSHYDEIPPMEDDSNEDFDTNRSKNKSSQEKDNDNGEETDSREIDEDCNATCEDNED
ncbi:uncharacterized protein LOC131844206 [Achroia grisella]|uniref:uncharacterized protein LOC131844206 n=1 Tax=Achroia grisella TaxID=688607 RepID=UPI0027D23B2B|nr:uncharacterized protein LOC131844206 [Achroia grisella]